MLAASGALPAWTAVRERGRLLARREERGAVWGRPSAALGQVWLLDESEDAAGLGIRLAGAGGRALAPPATRVIAWGAWGTGEQRRWVWRVDRMVALPGPGKPAPPARIPLPGHLVTELNAAPEGALPPSERTRSGPIAFAVLAAPVKPGDGWTIADQVGGDPAAALLLPGEAPLHGGLDYLSPDERWSLEPGAWYAAEVSVGRPPRSGELRVLRARAAPARIPPPPRAPDPRGKGPVLK